MLNETEASLLTFLIGLLPESVRGWAALGILAIGACVLIMFARHRWGQKVSPEIVMLQDSYDRLLARYKREKEAADECHEKLSKYKERDREQRKKIFDLENKIMDKDIELAQERKASEMLGWPSARK